GWDSHQELVDHMAAAAERAHKPLVVVSFMSNGLTRHWRGFSRARGLPLIEDLERGLQAVRHLVDYAEFRRRAEHGAAQASVGAVNASPAHALMASLRESIAALPKGTPLTEVESKRILGNAGLPVTREALARDPAEAAHIAAEIRRPVALKIQSREIPHKSDVGGVHLGARTPAEVADAAARVL